MVIGLRHRIALLHHLAFVVDGVGDAGAGILEGVGPGAIGGLPVAELAEHAERSAAERDAPPAVDGHGGAVVRIVVAGVAPQVGVDEGREVAVLEHQVHHPGDGVGAVLRRGPVAEHLDPVERAGGKRVEVDAARARAHAVVEVVDHRGLVAPPAVQQHQGVVRAQAAQREGPDDVAGVGHALPGEVHRRGHGLKDEAGLGAALLLQPLGREDVHRHRQLLRGRVARRASRPPRRSARAAPCSAPG